MHFLWIYTPGECWNGVSDKNDTALVLACLNDAMNQGLNFEGAIHHTDSDVRYCSAAYVNRAKESGLRMSMTVGNVYENAHAESLNATYKRQEINVNEYDNKQAAAGYLFRFKKIYNTQRPHSSLGNLTPQAFRLKFEAENAKKGLQF